MSKEGHVTLFGNPGEGDYDGLVAENRFISDIQLAIETSLAERRMTQTELARLLGVSSARVSQLLAGNGANMTARTVARIAHVLGVRACVAFADEAFMGWRQQSQQASESIDVADYVRIACETLEASGVVPGATANNPWEGGVDAANGPEGTLLGRAVAA